MDNCLKQLRNDAGHTLQSLGDMCGISKAHMHDLENGRSCPTLRTAYAISKVLDKSVYQIWFDKTKVVEETITIRRVKQ